jgi:hypothetical protein
MAMGLIFSPFPSVMQSSIPGFASHGIFNVTRLREAKGGGKMNAFFDELISKLVGWSRSAGCDMLALPQQCDTLGNLRQQLDRVRNTMEDIRLNSTDCCDNVFRSQGQPTVPKVCCFLHVNCLQRCEKAVEVEPG